MTNEERLKEIRSSIACNVRINDYWAAPQLGPAKAQEVGTVGVFYTTSYAQVLACDGGPIPDDLTVRCVVHPTKHAEFEPTREGRTFLYRIPSYKVTAVVSEAGSWEITKVE